VAVRGIYQLMLGGRNAQLIQLRIREDDLAIPEISAGKFAINVRFLRPDMTQRPRQVDSDVEFDMMLCNL
jgi:cell division protein ZapD